MLLNLLSTDSDWTLAVVRIILGVVFFAHGSQKLLGWFGGQGLKATIHTMHNQLGLPIPLALLAAAAEFLGGLGLIAGLLSRVAAAGIAVIIDAGEYGVCSDCEDEIGAKRLHAVPWAQRCLRCQEEFDQYRPDVEGHGLPQMVAA
jgi:hypothetical protein